MQGLFLRVSNLARAIADTFRYGKRGTCQTCVKIRRRLLGLIVLVVYLWLGPGIAQSLETDLSTMLATGLTGFCVLLLLGKVLRN